MKAPLKWIGYGLLGLFFFLLFLYKTFPYDQVKARLATTLEQQFGGAVQVTIGELRPHWFTGVRGYQAALLLRGDAKPVPLLTINRMTARVGVVSLLGGNPSVTFSLELPGGGELDGTFQKKNDLQEFTCTIDQLGLKEFPAIEQITGLKMQGRLDGAVQLEVNLAQLAQSRGSVELQLGDWRILKDSELKLGAFGTMKLDDTVVVAKGSESHIDMDVGGGAVRVGSLQLKGGDIELELTGQIFLEQQTASSRLNLKGQVKFSEKMREKLPVEMLGPSDPDTGAWPVELSGRMDQMRRKIGNFSF